ncbi:MAG: ferrochelatase, partial [Deltaproteobacteria bacterium]|nr:ferrochelatase [Deltaproteobacteria bacterium]
EIRRRYALIGGSPLLAITERLAAALSERLGLPVAVAMRFWAPLVPDVLARLAAAGHERVVVLPVAPHSVPLYARVADEARAGIPGGSSLELLPVEPYGVDPRFVEALAAPIRDALSRHDPATTRLLFTAHSLPQSVIAAGDRYAIELEATAAAVSAAVGRAARLVYQSEGEGGGAWLGPRLGDALAEAAAEGARSVVVAPIGFLAEHVETLYDLDVEAAAVARDVGLAFHRVPTPGDSPALVAALAALVERRLSA